MLLLIISVPPVPPMFRSVFQFPRPFRLSMFSRYLNILMVNSRCFQRFYTAFHISSSSRYRYFPFKQCSEVSYLNDFVYQRFQYPNILMIHSRCFLRLHVVLHISISFFINIFCPAVFRSVFPRPFSL